MTGRSPMRVVFAGGGTGGHLMPGLSLAEEFQLLWPDAEITFVGTRREIENDILRRAGMAHVSLCSARWRRRAWDMPAFLVRSTGGMLAALGALRRLRPRLVVGLGGYGSAAPVLAAVSLHAPVALMEQNALPGKANRFLARWARRIYCAWPEAREHFSCPERVLAMGNPVRRSILKPEPNAHRLFKLSPEKRTLLVLGGSQGAVALNQAVTRGLPMLERHADRIQIIHAAGKLGWPETCAAYAKSTVASAVFPFIHNMRAAYSAADLVLCRAGGTSLAEVAAVGLPSIMVPYPFAANDHQRLNAQVLTGRGAGLLLDQKDVTPARVGELVLDLLGDDERLSRMARCSAEAGRPEAGRRIAESLADLLRSPPAPAPRRRSAAARR